MAASLCTPNALWPSASAAGVRPLDASFSDRQLPVSHLSPGAHTVDRATFPEGVILIPLGHDPTGIPAVLPAIVTVSSSQTVTLDPDDLMDYGIGVTIVFTF